MLSFNNIGNLGRLGNQMFQYASLKGIAKNSGYEFLIPPKEIFGNLDLNVKGSDACLYDCFKFSNLNIGISQYPRLLESTFGFDENIYGDCPDNVDLCGYFQSEKYFNHIEDEIRKDFQFYDEIYEVSKKIFDQFFGGQEVISLHIRRGDYLVNPNHPTQSLEYYKKSLMYFDDNFPVIIFSDDPSWCNQQNIFNPDKFFISDGGDTRVDLCLMSMCSYHIIANSSYSWWGSWLAKSKKTIAPKQWFSGDCINHNTKDLYCSDWIIL